MDHPASSAAAPTTSASVPAPSTRSVSISGYAYAPATITVRAGARVTFTNHDPTNHTATAQNQSFDTGTLAQGQSRTLVFNKPGTYSYYCLFHAFMRAKLIVVT